MSYCRFSSMNWMCDVYCYEDRDGARVTHVASGRRVREPKPGDLDYASVTAEEWAEAHRQTMDDLKTIPFRQIGLPHDGKWFYDLTLEEFRGTLTMLRDAGYNVPEYVFEEITAEIDERDKASQASECGAGDDVS